MVGNAVAAAMRSWPATDRASVANGHQWESFWYRSFFTHAPDPRRPPEGWMSHAHQRGCEGGYWLGRDAAGITLADVVAAVDGSLMNVHGVSPDGLGTRRPRIGSRWCGRRSGCAPRRSSPV